MSEFSYAVYGCRVVSDRPLQHLSPCDGPAAAALEGDGGPVIRVYWRGPRASVPPLPEAQPEYCRERGGACGRFYRLGPGVGPGVGLGDGPGAQSGAGQGNLTGPADAGSNLLRWDAEDQFLTLLLSPGDCSIEIDWRGEDDHHCLEPILLGQGLAGLLRLLGRAVLHATAVEVDDRAFLLAGPAGAGKSITTLKLLDAGARLLAEDVSVLVDDPRSAACCVAPGNGLLRLNDAAVEPMRGTPATRFDAILGEGEFRPNKRIVPIPAGQRSAASSAQPIGGVYLLGKRSASESLNVTRLASAIALPQLLENSYGRDTMNRSELAVHFQCFARLLERVPVFRLSLPEGFSALESATPDLLEHMRTIAGPRADGL